MYNVYCTFIYIYYIYIYYIIHIIYSTSNHNTHMYESYNYDYVSDMIDICSTHGSASEQAPVFGASCRWLALGKEIRGKRMITYAARIYTAWIAPPPGRGTAGMPHPFSGAMHHCTKEQPLFSQSLQC